MSDKEQPGLGDPSEEGGLSISVVIPAYNEEKLLPRTLKALDKAVATYEAADLRSAEVIVVDNASTDQTAAAAAAAGARVISEPTPGIGAARNAGARAANAPRLLFLDADTIAPPETLLAIARHLDQDGCIGGAVATDYRPKKRLLRPYLAMWRIVATVFHMTQGIAQFTTTEAFDALRGYDTEKRMAEDTDFYRRLRRYAKERGERVEVVTEVQVIPSCRRLDEWPVWKTILKTNPLITRMFLTSERFWRGWGRDSVR